MKKNNAFTLAEILFVLVFVGVISIIALHTANNRFTDYFSRYYTAYDALSKACYNTYIDTYCRNANASADGISDCSPDKNEGEDFTGKGRPFPSTPQQLRKRLAEYLNITEESKSNINENKTFIKNAADTEFNNDTLQLSLTNGFRLYFSDEKSIEFKQGASSEEKEVKFFIVYVDLNGSAKPNRVGMHPDFSTSANPKPSSSTIRPDIVPFIVTSKGEVIPAGFPIYDRTYATARILDSNGNQTKSYTIDEARQIAYGIKKDPTSEEISENPCKGKICYYEDMPLTLIPKFDEALPGYIKPTEKGHVSYYISDPNTDAKDMECTAGTYNCIVKIDENAGKRF